MPKSKVDSFWDALDIFAKTRAAEDNAMTYDHWKTTNPDDEWLGPEPDEEDEAGCICSQCGGNGFYASELDDNDLCPFCRIGIDEEDMER